MLNQDYWDNSRGQINDFPIGIGLHQANFVSYVVKFPDHSIIVGLSSKLRNPAKSSLLHQQKLQK